MMGGLSLRQCTHTRCKSLVMYHYCIGYWVTTGGVTERLLLNDVSNLTAKSLALRRSIVTVHYSTIRNHCEGTRTKLNCG